MTRKCEWKLTLHTYSTELTHIIPITFSRQSTKALLKPFFKITTNDRDLKQHEQIILQQSSFSASLHWD